MKLKIYTQRKKEEQVDGNMQGLEGLDGG